MDQKKTYTFQPDWKDEFTKYMAGYALVPVFGIGIIVIRGLRKRQEKISYVISDNDITLKKKDESIIVNLGSIEEIKVEQTWLEQKFEIGRVLLEANGRIYVLRGIENPSRIEKILLIAIATENDRIRQKEKVKGDFPDLSAGSVDKVNTLVGLWQQGLIDDEEFERERKKI